MFHACFILFFIYFILFGARREEKMLGLDFFEYKLVGVMLQETNNFLALSI